MYLLKTEQSFDSAHFLSGYQGKCSNLHGHRWRIIAEIASEVLASEGQTRGMLIDFGDFKDTLKAIADSLDHALIIEKNSLKPSTLSALHDETFKIIEVDFRPTAENFSRYIYELMVKEGYPVRRITVYETPNNCATYQTEEIPDNCTVYQAEGGTL